MTSAVKPILVVDDDRDLRLMVELALNDEGYSVVTATNGREALAVVDNDLPSLILLDMRMPVMDGSEFVREFRIRHHHQVPIMVMTAAVNARQSARDVDAECYLSKPFGLDELLDTVKNCIRV